MLVVTLTPVSRNDTGAENANLSSVCGCEGCCPVPWACAGAAAASSRAPTTASARPAIAATAQGL